MGSPATLLGFTADGGNDPVNPAYLTFRAWHAEQVRRGGPDGHLDSA
ncbi:hypothetical protein [Deinococcus hopiensis]|nr:hypothetical protein [Deinococcus hopiensis]